MSENLKFLPKNKLRDFLAELQKNGRVFVTVRKNDTLFYEQFDPLKDQQIDLGRVRSPIPFKDFLFKAQEKLCAGSQDVSSGASQTVLVVGAKACDLAASLKVLDFVFAEGDFKDPQYVKRRENTVIISSDCAFAGKTCFCVAMGNKPYPQKDFDLNFSDIGDGFVVEAGSFKGKEIIEATKELLESTTTGSVNKRQDLRDEVFLQVKDNVAKESIPMKEQLSGAIDKGYDAPIWKEEAKTCVECGACNFICPTCHCFFLADELRLVKKDFPSGAKKASQEFERYRLWDACLYRNFARVAGGANPRKILWQRLRNRYDKKFAYFPKVLGEHACTGCGRCISCCPAKIDIRRILRNLVKFSNG